MLGSPVPALPAFEFARTCYKHLAGRLGVRLRECLERERLIRMVSDQYELTGAGAQRLPFLLGPRAERLHGKRCLDGTESRFHISGPLGTALLQALIEKEWVRRLGSERALQLTAAGRRILQRHLSIDLHVSS